MIPSVSHLKALTQNKQKGTIFRQEPLVFQAAFVQERMTSYLVMEPTGCSDCPGPGCVTSTVSSH